MAQVEVTWDNQIQRNWGTTGNFVINWGCKRQWQCPIHPRTKLASPVHLNLYSEMGQQRTDTPASCFDAESTSSAVGRKFASKVSKWNKSSQKGWTFDVVFRPPPRPDTWRLPSESARRSWHDVESTSRHVGRQLMHYEPGRPSHVTTVRSRDCRKKPTNRICRRRQNVVTLKRRSPERQHVSCNCLTSDVWGLIIKK